MQELLEAQLKRASAAVSSTENKAALVIPAIGVIAGIVGADVSPAVEESPWLQGLGLLAMACGLVAGVLAVVALAPRSHSNGPPSERAVRGTVEELPLARINYVKSLGFAVYAEENRLIDKSTLLTWSLSAFGVGVLFLTIFAAVGGLGD